MCVCLPIFIWLFGEEEEEGEERGREEGQGERESASELLLL